MSKSIESRLVELNAHLDRAVEFAQNPKQEEDNTGRKLAGRNLAVNTGLVGAGVGGLYLRGRAAAGFKGPNPRSIGATILDGANALKGDLGGAAATVGALAAKGGSKLNSAGRNLEASALIAARKAKRSMLGKV